MTDLRRLKRSYLYKSNLEDLSNNADIRILLVSLLSKQKRIVRELSDLSQEVRNNKNRVSKCIRLVENNE